MDMHGLQIVSVLCLPRLLTASCRGGAAAAAGGAGRAGGERGECRGAARVRGVGHALCLRARADLGCEYPPIQYTRALHGTMNWYQPGNKWNLPYAV